MERAASLVWVTIWRMIDGFWLAVPKLIIALVILLVTMGIAELAKSFSYRVALRARLDRTLARAIATLSNVGAYVVGALVAAVVVVPNFSFAHVIAGLGIYSVAIGFAFNNILQNFFAGLLLLWQKPFHIGDQIKTADFEGTVDDITIRATVLTTYGGERIIIPNGNVVTNPITVLTASKCRRVQIPFTIKTDCALKEVRSRAERILRDIPEVAKEPAPKLILIDADTDGLKFSVYFWTSPQQSDLLAASDKVTSALRSLAESLAMPPAKKAV